MILRPEIAEQIPERVSTLALPMSIDVEKAERVDMRAVRVCRFCQYAVIAVT